MLQRFRSLGMKDLSMVIINSKLSHSRAELSLLQDRVTFEVFQETEEEPVWDILEGGKDDMYIYDRCGRLTYYVPFPLSIINDETPLMQSALMASYFVSPCGITCDESSTALSKDDSHTDLKTVPPVPSLDKVTEYEDYTHWTTETMPYFNITDFNETLTNTEENATDVYEALNRTDTLNLSFNESDYEDNNETESPDFYNLIQRLFRNDIDYTTTEGYVDTSSLSNDENVTNYLENNTHLNESDVMINNTEKTLSNDILYRQIDASPEKVDSPKPKVKAPGRCAEADSEICKSWSKKKLLKAQRCCSSAMVGNELSENVSCRNFGKRRCKKIRYLLKCCIRTNIMEANDEVTTVEVKQEASIMIVPEDVTMETTTTAITTEENAYVCCKVVEKEKLCHAPGQSGCADDEFLERDTGQKKLP